MSAPEDLPWQPSLFAADRPSFDAQFATIVRRDLPPDAWLDVAPGWVSGADVLFDQLLASTPLRQRDTTMYDQRLPEPRLTHRWLLDERPPSPKKSSSRAADFSGEGPLPVLTEMAEALGARYGVAFTQIGVNLYRDGRDSVAWHGDRVAREMEAAIVALVSLGEPRPFKLRPKGGGRSIGFVPGRGDLLVMGGSCQRTWDHAVPKVSSAGPRMSVQFRHVYDRTRRSD